MLISQYSRKFCNCWTDRGGGYFDACRFPRGMKCHHINFVDFCFPPYLSQVKGKLAGCQHARELAVWTAAKFISLPHGCVRGQPMQQWLHPHRCLWERGGQVWSSPSALQLAGEACQWRSRADNCVCNILNQMNLTAPALIYYYRASVRGRPLRWGSRQYYTFQNTAPHTGFSLHSTQQ